MLTSWLAAGLMAIAAYDKSLQRQRLINEIMFLSGMSYRDVQEYAFETGFSLETIHSIVVRYRFRWH